MKQPETSMSAILLALWKPKRMDRGMQQAFQGNSGELFYKEFSNGELLVIDQTPGTIHLELYGVDADSCWLVDLCTGEFSQILGADPVVVVGTDRLVVNLDPIHFVVPDFHLDPSEEMIEFLHENPLGWEGDECGLILYNTDGNVAYTALPGDTVYRDQDGVYRVEKAKWTKS